MSPPSSRSSVARCCSASVSVGAISAAWRPLPTARSIAWRATTVLPDADLPHQEALHRMRADAGRRRSARRRRAGRRSARRAAREPSARSARRRRRAAARTAARSLARRRAASATSSRKSSSNASRRRAASSSSGDSGKWIASSAAGRSASRSAARSAAGSGSTASCASRARVADQLAQLRGRQLVGRRVDRDEPRGVDRRPPAPTTSCSETQKRFRGLSVPCSRTLRAGARAWLATHGWLNQIGERGPALVGHARLDPLLPPVAHRSDGDAPDRDLDGRPAPRRRARPSGVTSRRSRWECGKCSRRSPAVSIPSAPAASRAAPRRSTARPSRLGRGIDRRSAPSNSSAESRSAPANRVVRVGASVAAIATY